jgi:CBS domain-containing protein
MTRIRNTVGSMLEGRRLIVLSPGQTVREAAGVLTAHGIGAAPVVAGERLVGVFTERDILRRVVAAGRDADAATVGDVMTADPRTIDAATSLVSAFAIMVEGRFRHLPVVDGSGRAVAMLSMRDIPVEHRVMHRQWTEWTNGRSAKASAPA